jgi:hypothetical protein
MTFNINAFQSVFIGDGARPNLFQVTIQNPVAPIANFKTVFTVQAASIPESTMGVALVPYFGRQVKLAGNRTFTDWNVTIMNDEDFLVRDGLERWSNAINGMRSNLRSPALATSSQYKTNATVTQLSKVGIPLRTYNFYGLWPINVGAIPLDWGTNDDIERFDVTFAYDYWISGVGALGQIAAAAVN